MTDIEQSMIEFIVEEIRRARTAAGMTQETFGRTAKFSPSQVSAVENGTRALTRDYIRGADRALKTGGMFERLVEKLKLDGVPYWLREWIEIERRAEALRSYQGMLLPGLLQTEAYARAVFGSGGLLTPDQVAQRVAGRLERQTLLMREQPPQVNAVLDEGILHRPIGGTEVMREQLLHLVALAAESPHIRIQIVPLSVGAYPGVSGPFLVATLPGTENVAYLENQLEGQVVHRAPGLMWILKAWEAIRSEALPHQQSIELISGMAEKWR